MYLITYQDGIEICHNNGNEKTREYVFEYDIDKKEIICQNTFFPNSFVIEEPLLEPTENKVIEKGLLFYSFSYQKSFCHYMTQCLPKLSDYLQKYSDIPLLVPIAMHNKFQQNIFDILNITNIVWLEPGVLYNVNNIVTIPHYMAPPCMLTSQHLYIYNMLRDNACLQKTGEHKRKIYLKRDGVPSKEYGNSETGIIRAIKNENEVTEYLMSLGYEIVVLGTKTIKEKGEMLRNVDTIITPLGANVLNIIFGTCPRKVIYLSNMENFGEHAYSNLFQNIFEQNIEFHLLRFESIYSQCDPTNQWNSPFNVDMNILSNYV